MSTYTWKKKLIDRSIMEIPTPSPTRKPAASLSVDDIMSDAARNEKQSVFGEIALDLLGGSIQCAMPPMFVRDESVVRMCSEPHSYMVSGIFVGIWCLFYLIYYKTLFSVLSTWSLIGIWIFVAVMTYAVYVASMYNQIFDWRRNQLFQATVLDPSNGGLASQMGPWSVWRNTQVSESTMQTILVAGGLILCIVCSMLFIPAKTSMRWIEDVKDRAVTKGKSYSGLGE